jgi:hypothetical protein
MMTSRLMRVMSVFVVRRGAQLPNQPWHPAVAEAYNAAYTVASKMINAALKKLRKKSDRATGSINIKFYRRKVL